MRNSYLIDSKGLRNFKILKNSLIFHLEGSRISYLTGKYQECFHIAPQIEVLHFYQGKMGLILLNTLLGHPYHFRNVKRVFFEEIQFLSSILEIQNDIQPSNQNIKFATFHCINELPYFEIFKNRGWEQA